MNHTVVFPSVHINITGLQKNCDLQAVSLFHWHTFVLEKNHWQSQHQFWLYRNFFLKPIDTKTCKPYTKAFEVWTLQRFRKQTQPFNKQVFFNGFTTLSFSSASSCKLGSTIYVFNFYFDTYIIFLWICFLFLLYLFFQFFFIWFNLALSLNAR